MRIALLGLGFMGATHLRAWSKIPEAQLSAVFSSDDQKLGGDLSSVHGNLGAASNEFDFSHLKKYRVVEDVLADTEIDAVDICLPTYLHAAVTIAALRAGKHVLVEKPMSLDIEGADRMLEEAERCDRILMAAQVLRFIPQYRSLRELLLSGDYGSVRSALFRRRCAAPTWNAWVHIAGKSGGGIYDLMIHDVDYCLWTLGLPESVSATGFASLEEGVDTITANLHYPRIPSVVITGGWHNRGAYPFSMEYTVVSEKGTFEYDSLQSPDLHFYPVEGGTRVMPIAQEDGFEAELRYFLQCCTRGEQPSLCPPRESAQALRATLLLLHAREKQGEKISCRI